MAHRSENLPPDKKVWEDFLRNTQEEVSQFVQHVSGGHIYHVFIRGPASLAFGLGAILGTKSRVIGYHYGEDGKYQPVLDLSHDARAIKATLPDENFKHVKVQYPEVLSEDTAVVLNMASHAASGDVRAYLSNWEHPPAVVEVVNTYGGNLTAGDWIPVVREVYQVFIRLQRDPQVRRIHLFYSIPVPLALGIGMALGTPVQVTVYNWERAQNTYYPVLQLNQLESMI